MRTLRMIFAASDGKSKAVSMNYARDDLTALEVEEAMDLVVSKNLFGAGALLGASGAQLIERTETAIF